MAISTPPVAQAAAYEAGQAPITQIIKALADCHDGLGLSDADDRV